MDWKLAIDINREALKRILAMLVAMAGLEGLSPSSPAGAGPAVSGSSRPLHAFPHAAGMTDFGQGPKPASLPRHLHRAVLRLLRPAESAVRRLVIAAAWGIVVPPARPRQRKPGPAPIFLRRGSGGTGIVLPPGFSPRPRTSSPMGGVGDGDVETPARRIGFPLLDPLPRHRPRRAGTSGVPRISFPGSGRPLPVAARLPLMPDDPVDATRLALRLEALGRVLDDLPGQARRFARWRSRATAKPHEAETRNEGAQEKSSGRRRIWPLKPGLPPGARRPGSRRKGHEIDEILGATHGLAFWSMTHTDTS